MYLQLIHPHLLFVFLTRIIRRRIAGHWLVFCWLSGLGLVLPATAQTTAVAPAGSGTSGDPYIIASLGNLSYLAQNLGATDYWASGLYFVQTADIDASQTQY